VRDFLLGVRFVDGRGNPVRGGGKVVKNAAGFDLPKLMVGSLGRLGVMVELTFKVFPAPAAYASLQLTMTDLEQALSALQQASLAKVDLEALDLIPLDDGYQLWARLAGFEKTLHARLQRLEIALGGAKSVPEKIEQDFWRTGREFTWVPQGWSLVKLPLTPGKIPRLEAKLAGLHNLRRYSAGGQVVWIALEGSLDPLADLIQEMGLNALVLWGPAGIRWIGEQKGSSFYARFKSVLDPDHHFMEA
jgi:glycolate oxidase FAD binding subunit